MSKKKFNVWREGDCDASRTYETFGEHHAIERFCEDAENDGFGGEFMECGSDFVVCVAEIGKPSKRFTVFVTKHYDAQEIVGISKEMQP